MIPINELRIGNFVSTTPLVDDSIWHFQVEAIYDDGRVRLNNGDIFENTNIYPIPITGEKLLKFGFEDMSIIDCNCIYELMYKGKGCVHFEMDCISAYENGEKEFSVLFNGQFLTSLAGIHKFQNLCFEIMGQELIYNRTL